MEYKRCWTQTTKLPYCVSQSSFYVHTSQYKGQVSDNSEHTHTRSLTQFLYNTSSAILGKNLDQFYIPMLQL